MKINIKAVNLDLTPALNQYLEEKIGSLSKFLKNYEIEGEIQARVEVSRTTRHHHHGNVFRTEINLILPKKILRSVAEREDIRITIDEAKVLFAQEKKGSRRKKTILKELGPDPKTEKPVLILDGRYGPYISNGTRTFVSIPKDTKPEELTLEKALELIKDKKGKKKTQK